jgi:hypothetical protein
MSLCAAATTAAAFPAWPPLPIVAIIRLGNQVTVATRRPSLHVRTHGSADERALTMRAFYAQPCILSHGSLDPISARVQPFPLFR